MRLPRGLGADLGKWFAEVARPGETDVSGRSLWRAGRLVLTAVISLVNLIGVVAVVLGGFFVVPLPPGAKIVPGHVINAIAAAGFVAVSTPVAALVSTRGLSRLRDWLAEDRPATLAEQRLVLRAPLRLFAVQSIVWLCAAASFGVLNGVDTWQVGAEVAIIVAITGMVSAACAYLVTERLMRSLAVRAFANAPPDRLASSGVAVRAVLAWALGTGLPLAGLMAIGILDLSGSLRASASKLALSTVAIGGTGITIGLLAVTLAARATGDPVNSVRRALARVADGELDVRAPVYDGTQIGQLQAGFNLMVTGLAERERLREALGTYVDPAVAELILAGGTSLAGEEVEVTIMFIDIRDFTGFAERAPAPEVVASLNALFDLIVPIIDGHGGHVDKFIGDGLLAVFGAPRRQPGHADAALAAALDIERVLRREAAAAPPSLQVGIGLNSGTVVAGNVGGAGRFDFTVIGDAVNVAARAESATRQTGDSILLAQPTKDLLRTTQVALVPREHVTLKGKTEPVALYAPLTQFFPSDPG
ncbi:MAG TPA: adenylate/guanylate cyclase domain-containing protein [Streptosporangiaceae bacterium]|nr:adenylate/guanylate cyclase domain-containing protein [Streptosporangiaceae bacterium]